MKKKVNINKAFFCNAVAVCKECMFEDEHKSCLAWDIRNVINLLGIIDNDNDYYVDNNFKYIEIEYEENQNK